MWSGKTCPALFHDSQRQCCRLGSEAQRLFLTETCTAHSSAKQKWSQKQRCCLLLQNLPTRFFQVPHSSSAVNEFFRDGTRRFRLSQFERKFEINEIKLSRLPIVITVAGEQENNFKKLLICALYGGPYGASCTPPNFAAFWKKKDLFNCPTKILQSDEFAKFPTKKSVKENPSNTIKTFQSHQNSWIFQPFSFDDNKHLRKIKPKFSIPKFWKLAKFWLTSRTISTNYTFVFIILFIASRRYFTDRQVAGFQTHCAGRVSTEPFVLGSWA